MCCGGGMKNRSTIRITAQSNGRFTRIPAELSDFPKIAAETPPVVIGDDLLFRWSHIVKITKIIPGMSAVRSLEHKVQAHSCRSCQKPTVVFDRSPLKNARRFLGECSDETAKTVKQAAGILKYRVHYHDLSGVPKEVVR
jgi:hypothetical protein